LELLDEAENAIGEERGVMQPITTKTTVRTRPSRTMDFCEASRLIKR
jgi:hypothetical protein